MNRNKKEKLISHLTLFLMVSLFLYATFLLLFLSKNDNPIRYPYAILYILMVALIFIMNYQRMVINEYKKKIYQYSDELSEAIRRSDSIELNRKKQEIITLQSQINPHFLYNTLDTFRGIALEHEAYELVEMIGTLSSMLKYSVNYDGEMVSLNAELSYLNNYLKIQKLRFPGRFEYTKDIEIESDELLITMCPRLIIQPLIENSIRHGFHDVLKGGRIHLHIYHNDDEIIIEVSDNGCGIEAEEVKKINRLFEHPEERVQRKQGDGGLGINNVNDRIKMYCGKEYGLHFRSTPDIGTQAEIRMPRNTR